MRIYLVESSIHKSNLYTYRTLYSLMSTFGVDITDCDDEADVILVSVDDVDDLSTVRRARSIAGNRPLIAGGFECFCGEYLLAYVDACNVGEGFEFFEALGKAQSVDELYKLPYILTKDKKIVHPSTRIDAEKLPLVRTGKLQWYYLAGRGCKAKCAFCLTSFAQPYWHNHESLIERAERHVGRNSSGRLTLISNDSAEVKTRPKVRNVQSVRVQDYVKSPVAFQNSNMVHFGIEGFSEVHRRYFGKPIEDEMIFDLIRLLQRYTKPEAEFFFITGLPGTFDAMMEFADSVPVCANAYPRMFIKITTLNPTAHTPLWTFDIDNFEIVTDEQIEEFRRVLNSRNIGFRLFPRRSRVREVWRFAARQCTPDETDRLGRRPEANMPLDQFLAYLRDNGLWHLVKYDGRPMPNSQIVTPWRELRDKMAETRGLMPVNYKIGE